MKQKDIGQGRIFICYREDVGFYARCDGRIYEGAAVGISGSLEDALIAAAMYAARNGIELDLGPFWHAPEAVEVAERVFDNEYAQVCQSVDRPPY